MSDPVTALNHARYDGYVAVQEIGPQGMITLRGDLLSQGLRDVVSGLTAGDIPSRGGVVLTGNTACCWMSPDELLLLLPYDAVSGALADIASSLAASHHLAVDVSDARAVFRVTGPLLREVLAKLTPADVSPAMLSSGQLRRTRLGQVPAAFYLRDAETVEIICFRSVAQYVFDLLANAARPGGEVGLFRS